MKPTDTTKKGLESIIFSSLVVGAGYVRGGAGDFGREHVVDLAKLRQFLTATRPDTVEGLGLDQDGPQRAQLPHRRPGEITGRGVVDALRGGIKRGRSPKNKNLKVFGELDPRPIPPKARRVPGHKALPRVRIPPSARSKNSPEKGLFYFNPCLFT